MRNKVKSCVTVIHIWNGAATPTSASPEYTMLQCHNQQHSMSCTSIHCTPSLDLLLQLLTEHLTVQLHQHTTCFHSHINQTHYWLWPHHDSCRLKAETKTERTSHLLVPALHAHTQLVTSTFFWIRHLCMAILYPSNAVVDSFNPFLAIYLSGILILTYWLACWIEQIRKKKRWWWLMSYTVANPQYYVYGSWYVCHGMPKLYTITVTAKPMTPITMVSRVPIKNPIGKGTSE